MTTLENNLSDLSTRVASEVKSLRTIINGNQGNLAALTTTAKASLVAAINELDEAIDTLSGGTTVGALDDLTDVINTAAAVGEILRHNGTNYVNVLGTTHFDAAGAAAAAAAASQPLDSDLSAISALTTTPFGRAFLELTNQAALMALMAPASATVAGVVKLATPAEATSGVDTSLAVTPAGLAASIAALIGAAPSALDTLSELADALGDDPNFAATVTTSLSNKQPIDTDLSAIAALTSVADNMLYATGPGSWALTTITAAARSLLDDVDPAAMRVTLDVHSKAEIGNVEIDLVAVFEAGLL